ncbi:hypothetical protein E2C01_066006 [Portunus trituberculatus]|uniref:Uncharacterized protein n=1 Tax=Portunus trituberculatus TaxID=210409 RepID=A0A5B7HH34_PORTR|nr:hypothetical protein [Portunus trituberculatus]
MNRRTRERRKKKSDKKVQKKEEQEEEEKEEEEKEEEEEREDKVSCVLRAAVVCFLLVGLVKVVFPVTCHFRGTCCLGLDPRSLP